jgi:hypothetical protein
VECSFFLASESRQQRAESRQQRADSRQHRAESREQTAESREQRAESSVLRTRDSPEISGRACSFECVCVQTLVELAEDEHTFFLAFVACSS